MNIDIEAFDEGDCIKINLYDGMIYILKTRDGTVKVCSHNDVSRDDLSRLVYSKGTLTPAPGFEKD